MRRPALLAFGLFAFAASLPAEVRECLPMAAACEHRARAAGSACARAAVPRPACARAAQETASCPRTKRSPAPESCRLHPTPEAAPTREPLRAGAPQVAEPSVPRAEATVVDATRDGWIETARPRPRAAPLAAPLAPRPPPFAA